MSEVRCSAELLTLSLSRGLPRTKFGKADLADVPEANSLVELSSEHEDIALECQGKNAAAGLLSYDALQAVGDVDDD